MIKNYKEYGESGSYLVLTPFAEMNYRYSDCEIREYREYSYNGRTFIYIYHWAIMRDGKRIAFFDKEEGVERFFRNIFKTKKERVK